MMRIPAQRGFTLLIAVVLASVALAVGLALLDIAYKQVVLATSGKQSQTAFYAADSVLECALYWDQKEGAFDFAAPFSGLTCDGRAVTSYSTSATASTRTTTFSVPCATSGTMGLVTVYKASTGGTQIFATGYNICDPNNNRRIERGLRAAY